VALECRFKRSQGHGLFQAGRILRRKTMEREGLPDKHASQRRQKTSRRLPFDFLRHKRKMPGVLKSGECQRTPVGAEELAVAIG